VSAAGLRRPFGCGDRLDRMALALAAEFGGWDIGTCRSRDGRSLTAQRRAGASEPGVYAVITPDAGEMRRVLAEDERYGDGAPGG
jgi:hypothetical protein